MDPFDGHVEGIFLSSAFSAGASEAKWVYPRTRSTLDSIISERLRGS